MIKEEKQLILLLPVKDKARKLEASKKITLKRKLGDISASKIDSY